ncbi:MAG: GAF domain-containing protein [Candidatus Omnitrophica bacterium]|nr:GAF domain-containing protein [Candidatus Omnitrophota bacterium]
MNSANSTRKKLKISQSLEIEILRKIVEITNSELDLKWILKEVVNIVNGAIKADSVFIYLLDEKKNSFVLMASKTHHKKKLGKVILKAGEGITGWVALENKIAVIPKDAYKDFRFKSFDVLKEDKYEAFLSVPISYKKKVIGVINVQHGKAHDYTAGTVDLILVIAKQVSGVIVNARFYEETKKKASQFDSLVKVSRLITSGNYLDEILNLIVVVTTEMLNSKVCSIMLLDRKGNELAIKATQSLSEDYKKKPNLKVEESISGDVIKNRKPIVVYDVRKEKKYSFRALAVKKSLTSMLSVPMIVKNRAIGIINVYTKTPHLFTQEEIDVLQMVANQAAVAVENAELMDEALKAREVLETRKLIERAKGILVRMNDLTEDVAYRMIHKKSMDTCRTMKEIAESIILMDEIQRDRKKNF